MKRIAIIILMSVMISGCGSPQGSSQQKTKAMPAASQREYLSEGLEYLKDAKVAEAIKSFDEAVKQNPLDPTAYLILGQTYMRMNDFTRAIDSFAAAARVAPDSGEIFYLLAVNHKMLGDEEKAVEHAQKSVELFRQKQDEENFKKSLALLQGLMKQEE